MLLDNKIHIVILLHSHELIELDGLVELVRRKSLGLLDQARLFNVIHHAAVARRELILDLATELMLFLLRPRHLQKGISLEEFSKRFTDTEIIRLARVLVLKCGVILRLHVQRG